MLDKKHVIANAKPDKPREAKSVRLKGWLIALGACVAALVLLCVLKSDPAVSEFLARTFSRAWVWFFAHIFGWLPVSFYELFIIAAVAGVVFSLVKIIINLKRKEGMRALKVVVILATACVGFASVFTATASVCYNRSNIPLGREQFTVSDRELFDACEFYVTRLNEVSARLERDDDGIVKNPYTTKELGDILQKDFECLDVYDGFFSPYTPQAKGMASSFFMSALSLTGITFVPFGEPNINVQNPACDLPHTMAHEMAHSKGVMREYEANITANYVCLNSSDDFVLYSGLTNTVYDLLDLYLAQTGDNEGHDAFYDMLDDAISAENVAVFRFWMNQSSFFSDISEWFNNLYLKLNGQTGGTDSYREPPLVIEPVEPPTGEPAEPLPPDAAAPTVISYTQTQRIMLELFAKQK